MKCEPIEDWKHFIGYVHENKWVGLWSEAFLFRGVSDSGYGLEPSILRILQKQNLIEEEGLALEKEGTDFFQHEAHLHFNEGLFAGPADPLSWWALMQHYGAPTRLLDWTRSVFAAAYFAVKDVGQRKRTPDGAIYVLPLGDEQHKLWQLPVSKNGQVFFPLREAEPGLFTYLRRPFGRMSTQQGHFTLSSGILVDHRTLIDNQAGEHSKQCTKLIIPAGQKNAFLGYLRGLNVTAASLFPDKDGYGRSIEEWFRLKAAQCGYMKTIGKDKQA